MSKWEISTFEAFVNKGELSIQTGPFGTQLKASDYAESGSPVINVRNIGFGIIIDDNIEYIADETRDRLSSHILRKDDIVFGRKGAVERHAFVDQKHDGWLQGSDCIRVRIESPTLRPRYASYCLLTPAHKTWMANNCSHGATMASLNQDIVKRIEIPVPETQVQDQVISMLSAYDDLIENNNRRIAILEEMAQKLYCEWFVHFRFPGHENVKMVESERGLIPEGWSLQPISTVGQVVGGGTPSTKNAMYFTTQGIPWLCPRDFSKEEVKYISKGKIDITEAGYKASGAKMMPTGTVVFSSRAPIGYTAIAMNPLCTNQGFKSIIPNEGVSSEFIYYYLKNNLSLIDGYASGATFKEISSSQMKLVPVLVPNSSIMMRFDIIASSIGKQMYNLQLKNANLRKTRDLLLPRLISGDIDVSDLNIPIKEG